MSPKSNTMDGPMDRIRKHPRRWCITGVSGFIGSNLLEALLKLDQKVIGLDNFSSGSTENLEEVMQTVHESQWRNFELIEADLSDHSACRAVCKSTDFVLHHAAIGSVPRSIEDPIATNHSNISGFVNMINAARGGRS